GTRGERNLNFMLFSQHKLFLLAGVVALPAAVFACSSSSGGGGGSGGGHTTKTCSSSAVTNACTDSADKAAPMTHNATIGDDVSNCTLINLSSTDAASMCLQTKDGLSKNCADCFATYGACAAQKCLSACTGDGGASAPACNMCLSMNCEPAFE